MKIFGVRVIVLALIGYWLTIFAGTHMPDPPQIGQNVNDKVKHFLAYFGLTILLCAVTDADRRTRWFWYVAIIAASYGVFDEVTQQWVPGRFADVYDFVADVAGISAGLIAFWVGQKMLKVPAV